MADTSSARFFDRLAERAVARNTLLCVGLDPHRDDLPEPSAPAAQQFCQRIIDSTHEYAAAFKPNMAFFEALGAEGIAALKRVIAHIPEGIPVVLDAKRGDISTTAAAYASAAFEALGAHCATVNAYMGSDSVTPFLQYPQKGVFVLCKTSNPSSAELQELAVSDEVGAEPLFVRVARMCEAWNAAASGSVGAVVGATDLEALRRVRQVAPSLWILAPGVGAQGARAHDVVPAALRSDGLGVLVSVSRAISRAADPGAAARALRDEINAARAHGPALGSDELADFQRDFLALAEREGALKFGSFTLKSGRVSPYFFNAGLFRTGAAMSRLARAYARALLVSGVEFDVLFGLAYKGIPLVSAVAVALHAMTGRDVPFGYNRKEAKAHGEGGEVVGADLAGKRVVVVDDVLTAGTAMREGVRLLAGQGAHVVGVVIALDREECAPGEEARGVADRCSAAQSVERELGVRVVAVAGLRHLMAFVQARPEMAEQQEAVREYRAKFGVV